ncbi:amino acid adenylation domain-containing protein [Actinomycetes bacterium KLBMP 9797]
MSPGPGTQARIGQLSPAKRALLARLAAQHGSSSRDIARRAASSAPCSFEQRRIWLAGEIDPTGGSIPNANFGLRLVGRLDRTALTRAITRVVERHEILRTVFDAQPGAGEPRQLIRPAGAVALHEVDLQRGTTAEREQAARAVAQRLASERFPLDTGPLYRFTLLRLADDDHVLLFVCHHIGFDGWSVGLAIAELADGYRTAAPPAPLPIQYADYAAWSRDQLSPAALADRLRYWREQLADSTPVRDLPIARTRPPEKGGCSELVRLRLPMPLVDRLGHGSTPFTALLTAFAALLSRYTGRADLAIGSVLGSRPRVELESLIGCFVNMAAIRADLRGDPSFVEATARLQRAVTGALTHDLPFDTLVASLGDTALGKAVPRVGAIQLSSARVQLQDSDAGDWPGLAVSVWDTDVDDTLYDLALLVAPRPADVDVVFKYRTEAYDRAAITQMAGHFEALVRHAAAEPGTRLSTLELMPTGERRQLLDEWNRTEHPFPDQATLTSLIGAQAARTPDRVALACDGRTLSYAELDAGANRVAHRLRAAGVGPETVVAIAAERSLELMIGLVGILKASAAYLPLDPEYPRERLAFMLADAAPKMVLTQDRLRADLPVGDIPVLSLDDVLDWSGPRDAPPDLATPDNAAYVIYTSGSTGRPKGVVNTHRGIVNRLDWMQRAYPIDGSDTVLQKTPASFDVSVWEFFWPLMTGARLVLAPPGTHRDPAYLRDLVVAEKVTTLHFVPSMLAAFLAQDDVTSCRSLRRIICSGEELPVDLATGCLAALPAAELHNLYGPTEAAIDVTAWHCTADVLAGRSRVPIGAPIHNVKLRVLDAHLRLVPAGIPGQLFIVGTGLARGYLNRPGLTAERFLPDPYGPPGSRMYATGDVARWLPDGTVDFLGRIDNQVKVRGMRIELGEIEATLRESLDVREAAVAVREDVSGDKRLVGYLVTDAPMDSAAVRATLADRLPSHMVPSAFVTLDRLPLQPNGKLDRKALPAPSQDRVAGTPGAAPRTPAEESLAAVWREVLGVADLGIDDDFFDLGGHSLLAIHIVARARSTPYPVSVLDIYQHRTIRRLAESVDGGETDRDLLVRLTGPGDTLSLVCVPYGGGSATVYQPLADALPEGCALWAVALPGHDIGRANDPILPFEEAARRCTEQILDRVHGPLVLYGHCVGSSLTIEIARRLEAAGRAIDAVYVGGSFPFARPKRGLLGAFARMRESERLTNDTTSANWLRGIGADLGGLDDTEIASIVRTMRADARSAEDYFTRLLNERAEPLRAPVISVVGERDNLTEYYEERYREWQVITETTALVVLDEGGHYFLRYRTDELAEIVTTTHGMLDADPRAWGRRGDETWWRHEVSTRSSSGDDGPRPGLNRFLAVAGAQLVSMTGSAITQFALPIWAYLKSGSLVEFSLFAIVALVPGLVVGPVLGALIDRSDRRRAMIASDVAALVIVGVVFSLLAADRLGLPALYALLCALSVAAAAQRLTWISAAPQLVPKELLGHASGVVQMTTAMARLMVPLFAVGLLAWMDIEGVLALDIVSFLVSIAVVAAVRFPRRLAWRRRESVSAEIAGGFRVLWHSRGLRAMVLFYFFLNMFLFSAFIMISPLVLTMGSLGDAGRIATVAAAGGLCGGLAMTLWGGPRRRRMLGLLLTAGGVGVFSAVIGLRPSLLLVGVGVFGMYAALVLNDGIWLTVVHTKVPQRFHARALAINMLISLSTQPVGLALQAWLADAVLEPLLTPDGPLAGTVGQVIGVGPGRGIALLYVVCGLAMVLCAAIALRHPALARFDRDTPDAEPDDLVGLRALGDRSRT